MIKRHWAFLSVDSFFNEWRCLFGDVGDRFLLPWLNFWIFWYDAGWAHFHQFFRRFGISGILATSWIITSPGFGFTSGEKSEGDGRDEKWRGVECKCDSPFRWRFLNENIWRMASTEWEIRTFFVIKLVMYGAQNPPILAEMKWNVVERMREERK